jgi:sulfate permease, SulP family
MFYRLFKPSQANLKDEVLSGLTVALALVPEAVAFSLIAGVSPLIGLYTAFIIGLITSILGGRPGMISGATGAIAVVVVALVISHGVEYLFAAVVLMGLIQIAVGLLKLGKLIRLVPHPVMFGFVNGLAIVIAMAQFDQFKFTSPEGITQWMSGIPLYLMLGLGGTDNGHYQIFTQTYHSGTFSAGCYFDCIFTCYFRRNRYQNCGRFGLYQWWFT